MLKKLESFCGDLLPSVFGWPRILVTRNMSTKWAFVLYMDMCTPNMIDIGSNFSINQGSLVFDLGGRELISCKLSEWCVWLFHTCGTRKRVPLSSPGHPANKYYAQLCLSTQQAPNIEDPSFCARKTSMIFRPRAFYSTWWWVQQAKWQAI